MIIHNIEHKLCTSMSILLAVSVFLASPILFASNTDHVIRLVPGQEIYFSDYNIKCFKNNYHIINNTKHLNKKNIHFKGKAELQANNIKLGNKASVKIDNFKVKCLASNVFEKSDETLSIITTPETSYNSNTIFDILLEEEVHPKCVDKDDSSIIFEELESHSYSTGKASTTTTKESSVSVKVNLNNLFDTLFE